jgi:hypothetical protein
MDLFENVPTMGEDQEDGEFVYMPDHFGSDDEEFMSMVEFANPGNCKNVPPKVMDPPPPTLPEAPPPVEAIAEENANNLMKEELIIDDTAAPSDDTPEADSALDVEDAAPYVSAFQNDCDYDLDFPYVSQDYQPIEEILHDESDVGNTAEVGFF